MQGTWISVAYVVDSKALSGDERGKIELTIKGNMYTFTHDGKTGTEPYKPDASKKPRQLDILVTAGSAAGGRVVTLAPATKMPYPRGAP